MSLAEQQAMDALYAIDNVLTVKITMPQAEWDALRTEEPKGGPCNFDFTGTRYTWRKATSVEVSGTKFPAQPVKVNDVGLKKKSFCGSRNSEKPCLHVDFGKFVDSEAVQAVIGTRYLTLNNSIQDSSYIRQTLGYRMLAVAGLPHSRSNYAKVFVNGVLVGQGLAGVNTPGLFVNAEPIMKRYIERHFNGNMKGNLYELEHKDDFIAERLSFIGVESLSQFDDKADLKFAINHIAANGIAGVNQLFDVEEFIKAYAMDFYLKHWDGYADNTNNTYVYNDVAAVANPGLGSIKFKVIPWGIDQTWQPQRPFRLGKDGIVARLIRDDPTHRAQLFDQIRKYRETVFARDIQQTKWTPLINQMQALLAGFGVPDLAVKVDEVRHQLRLAESAGYLAAGLPADNAVYLLDENSQALHASNTESVPLGEVPPVNFEVYHWPLRDDNDKADLWRIEDLGDGKSVTTVAFDRQLHASTGLVSSDGHKLLYTCPGHDTGASDVFSLDKVDSPGENSFSGYCRLVSKRTNLGATYGADLTPGGRARVHQEGLGSKVYLY
jgi:CotH kinase protein